MTMTMANCSRDQAGSPSRSLQFDKYGGLSDMTGNNTSGFFRTQLIHNRWVFVDPDNHAFFSIGANNTSFEQDSSPLFGYSEYNHNFLSLFPAQNAKQLWVQQVTERYRELGFNTIGAWSENGLTVFQDAIPYTIVLGFGSSVGGDYGYGRCPDVNQGFSSNFPDVYDPRFEENAYAYARQAISPGTIDDPWLIGYFTDNEMSLFGGAQLIYSQYHTLADDFIALSSSYAGKQYWVNVFLRQKLGYSLDTLNRLYGTAFAGWSDLLNITKLPYNPAYPQIQTDKQAFIYDIASTYFSVVNGALKSVDPNHLNLCSRFASYAPDQFIEAAADSCDVISVNDYYALDNPASNGVLGDPVKRWTRMLMLSMNGHPGGKPFMQSEFSTRANDSGLPNSRGAGWTVGMQSDRVQFFRDDVGRLLGIKVSGVTFMAGFHWFEWGDEPATGRFDGENSNYGMFNIKNEPYTTMFDGMAGSIKALMFTLDHNAVMPALDPPEFVTETTLQSNAVNLSWKPVNGAGTYEVIVSPYRSMPERFTLEFDTITETRYTLPYTLPQGTWWFGVKAYGQNDIQSDFSVLESFTIDTSTGNAQLCMNMADPGCFTNNITDTYPAPDTMIGDGIVLPDTTVKDTGAQSAMIAFTLNSLALQAGLPVSALVTLGMNRPIPLNNAPTLFFDVYPLIVYTQSGMYKSATDFVHLRLMNGSTIVYDNPLPQSLPFYSWSTVGIPVSGTGFTEVTPVFYIDAHATDIPWDQRIVFYLDNIQE